MISEPINIFISSRMNGEVDKWRNSAIECIKELKRELRVNIIPITYEEENFQTSITTKSLSIKLVETCNIFICIYYKSISKVLKDEFDTANKKSMPIIILKKETNEKNISSSKKDSYYSLCDFLNNNAKPATQNKTKDDTSYSYHKFKGNDIKQIIKKYLIEILLNRSNMFTIPDKYILDTDDEDYTNLKLLYVKPNNFMNAEKILKSNKILMITGPAHTGKSTLAKVLAQRLLETKKIKRILIFTNEGKLSEIEKFKDNVIIFDDFLGSNYIHSQKFYLTEQFEDIKKLCKFNNYIIFTSRVELLEIAKNITKIGESLFLNYVTINILPSSYTEKDRLSISIKYLKYLNKSKEQIFFFKKYSSKILKSIYYPHNLVIFMNFGLEKATFSPDDLEQIIEVCKSFNKVMEMMLSMFSESNKDYFYFIGILSILSGHDIDVFFDLYKFLIMKIRNKRNTNLIVPTKDDLSSFREKTSLYIYYVNGIGFNHTSYREGIFKALIKNYCADFVIILKLLKEKIDLSSQNYRGAIIYSLEELGYFSPRDIIPFIVDILKSNWKRDNYALDAICQLGKAYPNITIPMILRLIEDDNSYISQDARTIIKEISKIQKNLVLSYCIEYIDDENYKFRFELLLSMENIILKSFNDLYSYLLKWSEDKNAYIRKAVALCLRNVSFVYSKKAISILYKLLNDSEWIVYRAAELSLNKILSNHKL